MALRSLGVVGHAVSAKAELEVPRTERCFFSVCRLHKPIGRPVTLGGPALTEHTLVDLQFREASHRGPPEQIGFGSFQRPREQLQLGERDIDVELFQQPDPAEGLTAAPGGLEHAQPARLSDMPDLDGHNPERHQQPTPLADGMEDGPVPALASQQPVFLVVSCPPKRLTESAIPMAAPRPSVAHSLVPLFVNTPGPPLLSDEPTRWWGSFRGALHWLEWPHPRRDHALRNVGGVGTRAVR